ncbi:hypothetical protein EZV62_022196 [Acer yangbiense]|uniref:CCHC-type domain-containing protein n=1 Tax=Acer yangbiense TaxID=1000413 RepID=A0A5C7H7S5_9ROSI|nr:hypothetical protein EZV62_022196 [Acer yangbiense]
MAAISHSCSTSMVKDKVAEFIHQCLSKSAYLQTYRGMIHPIPDQKRWSEVPTCILIEGQTEHMNPPPRIIQPGKPRSQRRKELDEASKEGTSGTVVCRGCGNAGHNQRTCKSKKKNKTIGTSVGADSSKPSI